MDTDAAVLNATETEQPFSESRPIQVESLKLGEPTGEEVLVEIGAASLCHSDVSITKGHWDSNPPVVMGHEGAGYVRAVGDDVTSLEPGDHVVLGRPACGKCPHCWNGLARLCPTRFETNERGTLRGGAVKFSRDGEPINHFTSVSSFSEYTVTTEEVAVKINEDIPMEEATLLGCGVPTGIGAITEAADVELGSSVVIFGAGGGVGLSAVQGARMRSAADIVAVDAVPEKLELARDLGATHTVNFTEEDPVERINEICPDGADYSLDCVGNLDVIEQCVDVLSATGTAVVVGLPPGGIQSLDLDLVEFLSMEKTITGTFNGSLNFQTALSDLSNLAANGTISLEPMVTAERTIHELNESMDDQDDGGHIRQVILPQ